jgi:hypothetical protein
MILYYSGIRGDICSPSVVLGDTANVMLSFWECGKDDGTAAAGFLRLESERKAKNRKPFVAYRDYHSDRLNETKYIVKDTFGKTLAGPTPLLTSLVHDFRPTSKLQFIVRINLDGSTTSVYKSTGTKWKAIKLASKE